MKLYLVGFMGVGKSTVGATLAEHLGWELRDLDEMIATRAGKPVDSIFAEDGEPTFRDAETRELAFVAALPCNAVVATGGGIVLRDENWALMRRSGLSIWLQADVATILERVRDDPVRPLLAVPDCESRVTALLAEREPRYRMADAAVWVASRSVDAIVEDILSAMESLPSSPGEVGPR